MLPLHETKQRSVTVVKGADFIYEDTIDLDICDGLVEYYETCSYLKKTPHNDDKVSEDLHLHVMLANSEPILHRYLTELSRVLNRYFEEYPYAGEMGCKIAHLFNIQRYPEGGGYKAWHWERMNHPETRDRHLVWMTYLTDNPDGGTEFKLQDKYYPARKGATLIWPADWTHTHRGRVCSTEKTIITGWVDLE